MNPPADAPDGPSPALRALWLLLDRAAADARDRSFRYDLRVMQRRLTDPLLIAIAGAVSAGKSTLVNALLGAPVAPVAAGEMSRHATWYQYGTDDGLVRVHTRDGDEAPPLRLGPERTFPEDLGVPDADILRVSVTMDVPVLRGLTVVDTPGGNTTTAELESRARAVLFGTDSPPAAQALVYVMPYVDRTGQQLLSEFRSLSRISGLGAANTLVVMSKIDNRAVAGTDPWPGARRRAAAARDDLRSLALDVIPVAGLLAETGRGRRLGPEHLAVLRTLTGPETDLEFLVEDLLDPSALPTLPGSLVTRRELVDRLRQYGLAVALDLLRRAPEADLDAVHEELVARSGFSGLPDTPTAPRAATTTTDAGATGCAATSAPGESTSRPVASGPLGSTEQDRASTDLAQALGFFAANAERLKSLHTLNQLHGYVPTGLVDADRMIFNGLIRDVERHDSIVRQMQGLRVTVALDTVSRGEVTLSQERMAELVRLARHDEPAARVGLPVDASADQIAEQARALAARWRSLAMSGGGRTLGRPALDVLDTFESLAQDPLGKAAAEAEAALSGTDLPVDLVLPVLPAALRDTVQLLAEGLWPAQRLGLPDTASAAELVERAAALAARLRVLTQRPLPMPARRQLAGVLDAVEELHARATQELAGR